MFTKENLLVHQKFGNKGKYISWGINSNFDRQMQIIWELFDRRLSLHVKIPRKSGIFRLTARYSSTEIWRLNIQDQGSLRSSQFKETVYIVSKCPFHVNKKIIK